MIERYENYSEMHENVKKAITCIISNPCNNLKDEIVKIKNQIDGITLSEWKDSSSVEFRICKNECSLKLGTIITSISNVFKYSEKTYDLLNKQLDNFKIVDDNYENVLKEKPKQSDYQKTVVENGISKTVNDTSAYESAHDYWQSVMTEIETAIRECVNKIEEYVQELDEINNLTITMSASLPYITETGSDVYVPTIIEYKAVKTSKFPVAYTTDIPADLKQGGYTVTCYESDGWHFRGSSKGSEVYEGSGQKLVHDAWNAKGSQYQNGIASFDDNGTTRLLVACTSKIGKVGDRLTFHLENGQTIEALVADQKSSSDKNYTYYGHANDGRINILEFEVDTAVYNVKGNPTTKKWGLPWDSSSKIVKVDNLGSAKEYLSTLL